MHTDESSQAIQSPIVVGIASLIPGLGFWLLGQRNRAIVTVTVVVGLGVLSILFREQPVSVLMAGTSGLAWLAQIIFSVQVATGLYHRSLGKTAPPREVNTRLFRRPSSLLSRHEANVLLGRNIAFQQLRLESAFSRQLLQEQEFHLVGCFSPGLHPCLLRAGIV